MNKNIKKETIKKVVFSAALMNVLMASNVALAAGTSRALQNKQQLASYEVTSTAGSSQTDWFDNDGCKFNNACKIE